MPRLVANDTSLFSVTCLFQINCQEQISIGLNLYNTTNAG